MITTPDVVVLGGGIAGLTSALALADTGRTVLLLDDRRAGAASLASAGMLGASLGFAPETATQAAAARDLYPAFLEALREATGIEVPLDRRGIVELADGEDDAERLHRDAPAASRRLDRVDLALLDARLAARHCGAVVHERDGAVDNVRLMEALALAAERHPRVATRPGTAIAMGAVREGACVFMASGERHVAARLVLAAGAWATQVAGLPRPLPVRPVRGELLTLEADPPPCVVYGGGGYLIPRGGAVLVGATSEDDGFVVRTSASGRESLLGVADRAAGLGGAHVASHWAGLRPMTPDNLPILGADPDHPWLVHAGGFSRNGILFAPWAARQVAVELGGASVAALDPFRAGRFQARPPRGPLNG